MKKYLIILTYAFFLCLSFSQISFAATIFAGFTYNFGTLATVDRQIYNPATDVFDNSFGRKYELSGGLGYLVGLTGKNLAVEYRITNENIKRGRVESPFRHSNIILTVRGDTGPRRPKLGIGYGTATSPSKGNAIISTDTNYDTTSYLLGLDFITNYRISNENRYFSLEYLTTIAHSRTFRINDTGTSDLGAREQLKYSQFVMRYIIKFGDIN